MTVFNEELIKTSIGKLFNPIVKPLKEEIIYIAQNRIIEYQVNLYKSLYRVKTILHRSEVIFKDIYEPVCLVDYQENIINPSELFNTNKRITILGEAGLGKSSIIRKIILDQIDKGNKFPILLELRDFNDKDDDLLDFINNEVLKFEGITEIERIQKRLFETGKLCIIFEGFDELSKHKKTSITQQIKKITNRFPENDYIITSRPYTGIEYFGNFTNYNLCELTSTQIESFIIRQFSKQKKSDLPQKIIKSIKEEKNKTYLNYLKNPLLLSLFLLTFDEHAGLPQKQSEFFSDIFETLVHTHNSLSKMGFERKLDTELDKHTLEKIIQNFSFLSFFDEKYIFSQEYFDAKINLIKEKKDYSFNTKDLENDLIIAIGILSKEGVKYLFPHKTLQEYFTISHIVQLPLELKIKVYGKTKELFFRKKNIGELNNFYVLLMEMDFCDSTEFFLIPLLKELKKDNIQRLTQKNDSEEERFFWSLDMLRFFNFEDFLIDGLFEKGTYLYKKMSQIRKYESEQKEIANEICTQKGRLKALHSEQKYLEKIIPTIDEKIEYLEKLESTSNAEAETRELIITLDDSKDKKAKEKLVLLDQIKESIISFNQEVDDYLEVKIPELESVLFRRRKSEEDLVDLI
jgi:hypothetical protein